MDELLRTNDAVLVSFVEVLLTEAKIRFIVLDSHMSTMEGSLGILPRRVLVSCENIALARRLLRDAGVGAELSPPHRESEI